ncbi:MAG: hypothetical protein FWG24_03160 [Eggerthellaceae bacterium]|jgi:hypothetical protein|nr:hypothetical protein [Eggerthellaceae bacterium]
MKARTRIKFTFAMLLALLCALYLSACIMVIGDSERGKPSIEKPRTELNGGGKNGSDDKEIDLRADDIATLCSGVWYAELWPGEYAAAIKGYLYIRSDGSMDFDFGTGYSQAGMGMVLHSGTWSFEPKGLNDPLVFDLAISDPSWVDNEYYFSTIKASYQFEVNNDVLTLTLVDGDALFHAFDGGRVVGIETYTFTLDQLY